MVRANGHGRTPQSCKCTARRRAACYPRDTLRAEGVETR